MVGFVTFIRRRLATRRFLTALPRRLRQDYGHRGPYTPEQVEATIRRHKVASLSFAHYAQAVFCDRESVEKLWRDCGRGYDYDEVRAAIGDAYFDGDAGFSDADVARFGGESSSDISDGGHGGVHSGDGGGHH